jgi:beta-lactamase regulating signal transducer with metallopeptidase domain
MEVVLSVGLGNAAAAVVLALAAAGAGLVCRRPALVHGLWLLVLLKLVTPPLWPVPVAWPEPSTPAVVEPPAAAPPVLEVPTATPEIVALPGGSGPSIPAEESFTAFAAPPDEPALEWQSLALSAWAAGAAGLACLTVVRIVRFRRLLRRLPAAPEDLQRRTKALAQRLGLRRCPLVCLVSAPISPLVWALAGRARLLVPAALWGQLGEDQRDLLLAHELAHLRRGDPWVRLLELLVLTLYWWHPVAWWARRRLQETGEECCDAWVVAAFPELALAYATTLVESAAFLSRRPALVPAGASGMGHVPLLRRRVTMILQGKPRARLSWAGLVVLLALAAMLLPLGPTCGQAETPEEVVPSAQHQPAAPQPSPAAAEKQFEAAMFFERTGHPQSAYFLYETILRRYAGTPLAEKAAERILAGKAQGEPEADLALVQARWKVFQAQYEVAQIELTRAKERLAEATAANASTLKALQQELEVRKARLQALQAEVRQAELLLEQARARQAAEAPAKLAPNELARAKGTWDARALFTETSWDFPAGGSDLVLEHSFGIKNTTSKTVRLSAVRSTSSKVSAQVGPTELRPGEATTVLLRINTGRLTAPKQFSAVVEFTEPGPAAVLLTVNVGLPQLSSAPPPKDDGVRFKEMEKRIEALQQELDALRKEMNRAKPAPGDKAPARSLSSYIIHDKQFNLPLSVPPHLRSEVGWVVLYLSRDDGKTWQTYAKSSPDSASVRFEASENGDYWFTVEMVDKQGRPLPGMPAGPREPMLKVTVAVPR